MIDYVVDFVKYISFNKLINSRIVKNDDSRKEKLYEYIDYVNDKQIEKSRVEANDIDHSSLRKRNVDIYAIDSSSRAVDTPYLFIAIGSATCINRFRSIYVDYPDITRILSNRDTSYRYIVLIPELSNFPETYYSDLKKNGIIVENPNGVTYDSKYSKHVVLDELRLRLENNMLEKTLSIDGLKDSIILIDGPIYYTPPVIYQYNELHSTRDKHIKEYIESWRTLVEKRISLINKLHSEKNTTVIGIVKRLQHSNLLSRLDPLNICSSSINDEAYLSIYIDKITRERGMRSYYIGPVIYDPSSDYAKLPIKNIYYFAVSRGVSHIETSLKTYVFFRVETINASEDAVYSVIYDSLFSGSLIPLSILIADTRAKKITQVLTNYFLNKTGIPSESTSLYITL